MPDISIIVISFILGIVLFLSAWDKVKDLKKTFVKIEAYRLLHKKIVKPFAIIATLLEFYLSFRLVSLNFNVVDGLMFTILMSIFMIGIGINLYVGNTEISCGCGGVLEKDRLSINHIYRNAILIFTALLIAFSEINIPTIPYLAFSGIIAIITVLIIDMVTELQTQRLLLNKLLIKAKS